MGKVFFMRTLTITALMMFALTIFLTLSGCSTTSQNAHMQGGMDKDAHMHGEMNKEVQSSESTNQTTCPVLGGDIDKQFYVDHMGKRVYLCCKMCIEKFNKEPEKYMEKL